MSYPDAHFDLRQLIDEYFLRDLSEQEIEALNEALAGDPSLRAYFIESMHEDLDLHEAFQQVEEEQSLRKTIVVHRRPRKRIVIRPRERRPQKRTNPVLKIAASLLWLAGAGLVAYVIMNRPEPTPSVSVETYETLAKVTDLFAVDGDPISVVHTGRARTLQLGDYLREEERVSIPPGGRLEVTYLSDLTSISFDPGSSFHLLKTGGANGLALTRGCLMAEVAKQPPGQAFRLTTDDAEVVVLGTRFELRNKDVTRVSVAAGEIQMNALWEEESVLVAAGYFAESAQGQLSEPAAFHWEDLTPTSSATLPKARRKDAIDRYITVDPGRDLKGRLDFQIPPHHGRIREASLKLRVVSFETESGGEGTIRVRKVKRKDGSDGDGNFQRAPQIGQYTGKAAVGMDLVIELDPALLAVGSTHLLLSMDEGGDDFWFAAHESPHPPELRLTIVE